MTKADLVAQIAAKANMTKAAAERSLNAMLESVQDLLAEEGQAHPDRLRNVHRRDRGKNGRAQPPHR